MYKMNGISLSEWTRYELTVVSFVADMVLTYCDLVRGPEKIKDGKQSGSYIDRKGMLIKIRKQD